MKTYRTTGGVLLVLALVSIAAPASAQKATPPASGVMVPPPTPDADALAAQMRTLAADPKNVAALTRAGELTLKLGDPTAAAVLFSRADEVSPNSGRLKGDEAAVLVHMERPGEALRLFQQAERLGADPADFAAERGLAYDLIGQQDRAQRDYRLALKANPTDSETLRRYALSLGISGKRDPALALIDPLVRQQDHAGWRDRAFILAMTGAPDQAESIAKGMLPADMANGLSPFFQRLPQLPAADRAFAVHFGEVAPTPERLADARLTPPLPTLAPEAAAPPIQLAAAAPAETSRERKRREKEERRLAKQQKSQPVAARTVVAAADTKPPAMPQSGSSMPAAAIRAQAKPASAAPIPVTVRNVPMPAPVTTSASTPIETRSPVIPVSTARVTPAPVTTRNATTAPAREVASAAPMRSVPLSTPARSTSDAPLMEKPAARVGQEDQILKNIMAGISVPASELGVAPIAPASTPTPTPTPTPTAVGPAPTQLAAATPNDAAAKAKALEAANAAAIKQRDDDKAAAAAKLAADRKAKADAAKKAADAKAAADKKAADIKAAADKKAAEKKAKADPSRIWVQVAGGANENDLPKAWAKVKAKAPEAFKGKSGWSTPLNATNRVLAGPFKTDDAAQDFVNALRKAGLSGFPFTSTAGQQVDKLPAK